MAIFILKTTMTHENAPGRDFLNYGYDTPRRVVNFFLTGGVWGLKIDFHERSLIGNGGN